MNYPLTRRRLLGASAVSLFAACAPRRLLLDGGRGSRDTLKIVFMTDLHLRNSSVCDGVLERLCREVKTTGAEILLGGGDWCDEGMRSPKDVILPALGKVKAAFDSIGPKHLVIPGNHDHIDVFRQPKAELLEPYFSVFGRESYRSIQDVAGYTLITLPTLDFNSQVGDPYKAMVIADDVAWLKSELVRVNSKQPIILLLHAPLLSLFFQRTQGPAFIPDQGKIICNNLEVLECFNDHNLHLVLQGHLHINEFIRWNSTTFVTGGALCGRWWQGANYGTPAGFGVLTLRRQHIEWDYRAFLI